MRDDKLGSSYSGGGKALKLRRLSFVPHRTLLSRTLVHYPQLNSRPIVFELSVMPGKTLKS
jgi:hypothetical protein